MRAFIQSLTLFAMAIGGLAASTTDSSADRRRSPVSESQNLSPDTRPASARVAPVPELVLRDELQREGRRSPWPVFRYEEFAKYVANLRDNELMTHSGLPQLSVYYRELHKSLRGQPVGTSGIAHLFEQYEKWRKEGRYDPYLDVFVAIRKEALLYQRVVWSQQQTSDAESYAKEVPGLAAGFFQYLNDHHSAASADPGWYYIALQSYSYRCNEWNDAWSLLKEGSEKFPHYYELYFRIYEVGFMCGVDPAQLMDDVIDLAVERTSNKHGDAMYARLKWLQTDFYGPELMRSQIVDWNRMRQGIGDVLADYPDAWNTNNFAYFACIAEDDELAAKLLSEAMRLPVNSVWRDEVTLKACRSRIERAKFIKESNARN